MTAAYAERLIPRERPYLNKSYSLSDIYERFMGKKPGLKDKFDMRELKIAHIYGWTNTEAAYFFTYMSPFRQRLSRMEPEQAVDTMYLAIFERPADNDGKALYSQQLNNGRTHWEIAEEMLISPEGRKKYINDLYRELLGRDADRAGLDIYAAKLEGQKDPFVLETVADELALSEEYRQLVVVNRTKAALQKNRKDFARWWMKEDIYLSRQARNYYKKIHGSSPGIADEAKLLIDVMKIHAGNMTLTELLDKLRRSQDFANLVVRVSNRIHWKLALYHLFKLILDRKYDKQGFGFYSNRIDLGGNIIDVLNDMLNSQEYRENSVKSLFNELLFREPDAEGLGIFADQLAQGRSLADIALELRKSSEYQELTHSF